MMVEAFTGDNIRPTQGGPDAISLQDASAGWVTLGFWFVSVIVAQESRPAHAERVIIAYVSPSTSYLPLMVAYKKGFFEEENFQTDLVRTNITVIIQALIAGSVDYVTTFYGKHHSSDARGTVGGGGFLRSETDGFPGGCKRNRFGARSQRKGGRHQRSRQCDAPANASGLEGIGLDPAKDVTIRSIGGEDVRFQALDSGIIQAALLGSQGVIQGEKAGLKVIVPAADVIDSLAFSGLATSAKKLKENPEQVKRMLRATLKGLRYVWENKNGTVDVIESWLKVDRKIASMTYDLALQSYSRNGEVDDRGILLTVDMINAREK